jgi:hypothetical protein
MKGETIAKSGCSNECKYLFYECEAEECTSLACKRDFNQCVWKCLVIQLSRH